MPYLGQESIILYIDPFYSRNAKGETNIYHKSHRIDHINGELLNLHVIIDQNR